jgi:CheY-like chemotaxis protein
VNDAVLTTHGLLRRALSASIEIVVLAAEGLWPVWMDRGQLEQLLMNLALNARDAMPNGGKLTFETLNETLREPSGVLSAGDYVKLSVTDTGTGIAPGALAHVFEPFFTTKRPGQGTGLGLATCYAIVRRVGGEIQVMSEPGAGTTFVIRLPRTEQDGSAARTSSGLDPAKLTGTETILVVEDDSAVLGATTLALQKYGYRVLQTQSGEAACRVLDRDDGSVALVLTDIVMPCMNGPELAERLAKTHPGLPVLLMSGYADERAMNHNVLLGASVLSKPFLPQDLARRVREVLDARVRA